MTASTNAPTAPARSTRATMIAALVAAAAISLVNLAIASVSLAFGTPSVVQLTPGPYVTFSVVAGVLGAVGWAIVRRRAKNPRRTLTVLAIAALVLSFVPLAVLAAGTVGTLAWTPIVTLAIMHAATVGVAVLVFSKLLPVGRIAS